MASLATLCFLDILEIVIIACIDLNANSIACSYPLIDVKVMNIDQVLILWNCKLGNDGLIL
jgi:hypothetical protein